MLDATQDEELLAERLAEGRAAWPGISLEPAEFVRRLRELDVRREDLEARAPELVLAFACAAGDPAAIGWFDARFLSVIGTYVTRFNLPVHVIDEVRQRVRMKQLLGDLPGIARYRGRGPLGAWVRVTAVRVAVDVATESATTLPSLDIDLPELWRSFDEGPEVETLKKVYRERLMSALEESLTLLEPRDRTLLRLHVVDDLGIDAMARIYRVHRATVARWLVAIRRRIFEILRDKLALRFGMSTTELRSVIKLLQSEIHLSAQRVLDGG